MSRLSVALRKTIEAQSRLVSQYYRANCNLFHQMFQRLSSVPLMGKLCSSSIWIRNNWYFCGEQVLTWLLFIYLIYPSHPFLTRQNHLRYLFIVSVKVEKSPCCFILLYASVCPSFYGTGYVYLLKGVIARYFWRYGIMITWILYSVLISWSVFEVVACLNCEICNVFFVTSRFSWGQQMIDSCIGKTIQIRVNVMKTTQL